VATVSRPVERAGKNQPVMKEAEAPGPGEENPVPNKGKKSEKRRI